jgi:hypothetical protein
VTTAECQNLKKKYNIKSFIAIHLISKEEGHVCPASPPPLQKNKRQQTNEKYTNIVYNTLLEIFGSPAHYL